MLGAYDFHSPLTSDLLISEVAGGTFAFKNQIKARSVKQLWEKLGLFISDTLKQQKGVLLPSLGTFRVGPVVGESVKKIRPCFSLLDARYGAVSQERLKFIVGGKAPIVQPNYGLLSTSAAVHRGAGQRLIHELLQRLGVHILSQRPIKVEIPCVGRLQTNRAGRMEFVFDALLAEYFERENTAVIREMHYSPADYEVQKGLQNVTLGDPPLIKSPRGVSRPVSAVSGVSRRERVLQQVHAPYSPSLMDLLRRCKAADRTASGCVPRLHLEQWLQQDCRDSLAQLNGAALMDLLDVHTYGKTSKQIMYKQFLDALDSALASEAGYQPQVRFSPSQPPRPAVGRDAPEQQQQRGAWPPQPQAQGQQQQQVEGLGSEASAEDLVVQQQVPSPPPPSEPQPQQYPHYCQHQLSPRSRSDYDAFNRLHFQQLQSVRGRTNGHRAVTPKVGEEPLNVQEYHAVRSAAVSPRGRGRTPGQAWPEHQHQQYQQYQQLPVAAAAAAAAAQGHASQQAPPRSYHHTPQVMQILHQGPHSPSPGTGAGAGVVPARSSGPEDQGQGYNILAPPPLAAPRLEHADSPLSQYDISREQDPGVKARLKAEYATQLQEGWDKQIREKGELQEVLQEKELRWPFGPTGVPMDKRPVSAISRPWAPVSPPLSPRRLNAFQPHA